MMDGLEGILRVLVKRNRDARESLAKMTTRVTSAVLSGSSEDLSDADRELASELDRVFQEQREDSELGSPDSSAGSGSESE